MSDSLWPNGLQYTRLPCPSLFPQVCSNSCPLSQWCHPTISSSITPFSFCPQSFPASESFLVNQLFASDGQSIGSFNLSINPSNEYSGLISFRIDWFDLIYKSVHHLFSVIIFLIFCVNSILLWYNNPKFHL